MIYALRLLWYVVRRALHAAYAVLHFFGKPGSRILVPLAAAALLFYQFDAAHGGMAEAFRIYGNQPWPDPPLVTLALVALWIVFAGLYWLGSRALGLILGTFPMMARPLPPLRPVRAIKKRKEMGRAVVRVAVPSLPRRRALAVPPPPLPAAAPLPLAPAVVRLDVPPLPRRAEDRTERQAAE